MTTHSTAQLIGGRSHQCDATATYTHEAAAPTSSSTGSAATKIDL